MNIMNIHGYLIIVITVVNALKHALKMQLLKNLITLIDLNLYLNFVKAVLIYVQFV